VGTANFAERAGVAAVSCPTERDALLKTVELVKRFPLNNLASLPIFDFEPVSSGVNRADVIACVADEKSTVGIFDNLGSGARTALATIGGVPCGVIATSGELTRRDTAKCARLVEICDSFSIPVVSFVDSEGLEKSADSDRLGGIRNAAKLANVLSEATTVKVTVVTGKAIGTVYAMFCGKIGGSADMTYAWDDAVIGPMPCEIAVELLWHDRIKEQGDIAALAAEYAKNEASAFKAAEAGAVDAVISPDNTREIIIDAFKMLSGKRATRLPKKHGNLPL
ncbi:MAG: carboxyl transferase domain-containing protein, partial [Oscillospiraceae bacterium]